MDVCIASFVITVAFSFMVVSGSHITFAFKTCFNWYAHLSFELWLFQWSFWLTVSRKQKEPGHTVRHNTPWQHYAENSFREEKKRKTYGQHCETQHQTDNHIHTRAPTPKSCKLQREATKEWICYNIFIFNTATRIFGKMRKKTRIRALKLNRQLRACPFTCL